MADIRLGINLWSQGASWTDILAAGQAADRLGYDHLWTWDHLLPIFGDPDQPIVEGYTTLAALAQATERIRLGLFVGANTFRNPGLAVKSIVTIDHISAGRAMLGLGGAWFELEHRAFGIDFGSGFGQRLDWLAEAVPVARVLLDGETVSSEPGGRYAFDDLRILPLPVQAHLPIVIGGSGERKTLPIVARWADMWNAFGSPDELAAKDAILRARCEDVGRDPSTDRALGRLQGDDPLHAGRGAGGRGPVARSQQGVALAARHRRHVLDGHARVGGRDDARLHPHRIRHLHRRAASAVRPRDDDDAHRGRPPDGRGRLSPVRRPSASGRVLPEAADRRSPAIVRRWRPP